MELNREQMRAVNSAKVSRLLWIQGEAGTGKTFAVNAIIEANPGKHIIFVAPTNKLVAAARKALPPHVECITSHKAGGVKMEEIGVDLVGIHKDGREKACDIFVVDEISMIENTIFETICQNADKVIVLGDKNQLQQIKPNKRIKWSEYPELKVVRLTQQMRQLDTSEDMYKLITCYKSAVEHESPSIPEPLLPFKGDGTVKQLPDKKTLLGEMAEEEDHSKVVYLSWTNADCIDTVNHLLGGRPFLYEVGDEIVVQDPLYEDDEVVMPSGTVAIITSVEGIATVSNTFIVGLEDPYDESIYYGKFKVCIDAGQRSKKKSKLWGEGKKRSGYDKYAPYWDFVKETGEIRHSFVSTVHKAQGSTYDTVYINIANINGSIKNEKNLKNRLGYVAFSRASKQVKFIGGIK